MRYWQSSNKEHAEQRAFWRAIGYLQGRKECAEQISVDEILNFMLTSAKEIHDHLNETFTEYAPE